MEIQMGEAQNIIDKVIQNLEQWQSFREYWDSIDTMTQDKMKREIRDGITTDLLDLASKGYKYGYDFAIEYFTNRI